MVEGVQGLVAGLTRQGVVEGIQGLMTLPTSSHHCYAFKDMFTTGMYLVLSSHYVARSGKVHTRRVPGYTLYDTPFSKVFLNCIPRYRSRNSLISGTYNN